MYGRITLLRLILYHLKALLYFRILTVELPASWTKLGPYPVNITDGAINVSSSGGHANFSGIEVWTGTSGAAARTSAIARTATLEEETAGIVRPWRRIQTLSQQS